MDWNVISAKFDRVRAGDTDLQKKIRGLRRRLTLCAVVGRADHLQLDNDAEGFPLYASRRQYGYALLWSLIPMTDCSLRHGKMCARMAWSPGKLSDLIRRSSDSLDVFLMITGFLWTLPTCGGVCRSRGIHCRFLGEQVRGGAIAAIVVGF